MGGWGLNITGRLLGRAQLGIDQALGHGPVAGGLAIGAAFSFPDFVGQLFDAFAARGWIHGGVHCTVASTATGEWRNSSASATRAPWTSSTRPSGTCW